MKQIVIYTDGASQVHKSKVGGWGAILQYFVDDKLISTKEIYGGEKNTTNNIMEIRAVIEALRLVKTTDTQIKVYSDSAYVVNCMTQQWYVKWQYNGWRTAKKPVKNKEVWEELIPLVEGQWGIDFIWVKGHNGNEYNEKADDLAEIGLQEMLVGA
jgi:ribonuclease HI